MDKKTVIRLILECVKYAAVLLLGAIGGEVVL